MKENSATASLSSGAVRRRVRIDFDMILLVIASGLYRLMAKRMRSYADAQARQIFRDLIDTPPLSPSPTKKSW